MTGDKPCPTCSGPSRETVGMVCQTCGTDYGNDTPGFPPLLPSARLHACQTCGAVVVRASIDFHDQWHKAISSVAIETTKRVDEIEERADRAAMIGMQSWDAAERNP